MMKLMNDVTHLAFLLPLMIRSVLHARRGGEADTAEPTADNRGGSDPGSPLRTRGRGEDPPHRRRAPHQTGRAGRHQ